MDLSFPYCLSDTTLNGSEPRLPGLELNEHDICYVVPEVTIKNNEVNRIKNRSHVGWMVTEAWKHWRDLLQCFTKLPDPRSCNSVLTDFFHSRPYSLVHFGVDFVSPPLIQSVKLTLVVFCESIDLALEMRLGFFNL